MIEGHGGMLDRLDSVSFAAPVFFHLDALLLQLIGVLAPRARRSRQGNLRTMAGAGGAGFWQTSAHGKRSVYRGLGIGVLVAGAAAAALLLWVAAGRDGDAVAQAVGAGGDQALRYDTEYPTMHYATAQRSDPVTKLQARLARGEVEARGGPARLPRLAAHRTSRSIRRPRRSCSRRRACRAGESDPRRRARSISTMRSTSRGCSRARSRSARWTRTWARCSTCWSSRDLRPPERRNPPPRLRRSSSTSSRAA